MTSEDLIRLERPTVAAVDAGFEVSVAVTNVSKRPVFVTGDPRRIEIDEAQTTVKLWFSDHGRFATIDEPGRRQHALPDTRALEAGESCELRAIVPTTLHRLLIEDDESFDVEVLDLSGVRRIDIVVAAAREPFYPNPKRGHVLEQLDEWGVDATTSVEVSGPARAS